ncbi:hypothetical protein DPMN_024610 [Dreissena polymorpha]|uniref:Uncharacterized protein n=1 Tax=Dreissena polymorpha TaxID=45954 RepID=A0A9D4RAX5_DREPO|nr:hypothetical protein DPMN_024610 [Dreissena polymorpha]
MSKIDPNSVTFNRAGYTLENVQNGFKFGLYQQDWLHCCKCPEWTQTVQNQQNWQHSCKCPECIQIRSVSTRLGTFLKMSRTDSHSVSINRTGYTLENIQNGSKIAQNQQDWLQSCKYPEWIQIRSVSTGLGTLLKMSIMDPNSVSSNRTGYTLKNVKNESKFGQYQHGWLHS